jgi:hypothetical protein
MQENDLLKSNNHDDQSHIDPEQNDQQQTNTGQEKQMQDTSQEQHSEPSKSVNLPTWLRAEMGDSPETQEKQTQGTPQEQPSGSPSSVNRIVWSREEMGTLPEQRPMRTRSYQAMSVERGGCLTAWLILLGIGDVLAIVGALIAFSQPGYGLLGLLLLIGAVLAFAGVIGTWQFKRWGYYSIMTLYGINVVIGVISLCVSSSSGTPTTTGSSIGSIIGGAIGMFTLYLLVREKWEAFE